MLARRFATTNFTRQFLSQAQVEQFHKDGWLYLPKFLSAELSSSFKMWCEQIEALPETAGKWMKYYEVDKQGNRLPCRIENFTTYHDKMHEFVNGYLLDFASDLYGEQAVAYKEKINFKYPNGGSFTAHQDQPAYVTFGLNHLVTILLPIDDNTRKTGGLDFVKKHNMDYILPQNTDGSIRTDIEARMDWQPTDCYPGDVFLFDSYAPHRSDINTSTMTRRNLYLTYNRLKDGSFREGYYEQKRTHFPPEIERDPNKDYSEGAKVFNVANPIK